MHSKLAISAFLLAGLPGCIFYSKHDQSFVDGHQGDDTGRPDQPHPDDTDVPYDTDTNGRDTDTVDTDLVDTDVADTDLNDTDVATAAFVFAPDHATAGTTSIVSLLGDGSPDMAHVASVSFYGTGGVTSLALSHRSAAEVLLTVDVPDNALAGPQDVLVEFDDNTAVFLTDAFTVDANP